MTEADISGDPDSLLLKKQLLRKQVLEYIKSHLGEKGSRKKDSLAALDFLVKSRIWQNAASVFLFYATEFEIDTEPVIFEGINAGKSIFLPRIIKKGEMVFIRVWDKSCNVKKLPSLEKNRFGIMEPAMPEGGIMPVLPVSNDEIPVLVLVPGRAFTKNGERLGLGGGFYDRYLKMIKEKIPSECLTFTGYCFNEQIVDYVPWESHDVKMDKILTPGGFIL